MLKVNISVFQKVFWVFFVFALLAGSAFGAISDSDFIELCVEGSLQQISEAIKDGANVNAKVNGGFTPLLYATAANPDQKAVIALIDAGADVNARNRAGWTPLILAAGSGNPNPEVIKALINAGADVNARVMEDKSTPLILAAEHCSKPEVITLLLDSGANPAKKRIIFQDRGSDDATKLAIDYARENENLKDTDILRRLEEETRSSEAAAKKDGEFIELCKTGSLQQINDAILNGANVNARNEENETPLMRTVANNSGLEVTTALINAGADVNLKDDNGATALLSAAAHSTDPEVIKTLINAGASVNSSDYSGYAPLMLAVLNNPNPDVAAVLLEHGANPKAKNRHGKMALDFAGGNKNLKDTEVLKRLEEISR
jgi:ankyrin repeat protein